MAKFVYFFIAALALQAVSARPKKANQEKTRSIRIVENLDVLRRELLARIQKVKSSNKEVNNALLSTFATTIEQGTRNLAEHTEFNKPLVEKMVKEASDEIVESIKRNNVETNINTIFTEGKKVEEALKPTIEFAQ